MLIKITNKVVWTLRRGGSQFWLQRGLHTKQSNFLCHLGDNLQTAITVAKNSEMIPQGSQVILVEANEPEEFVPASVTWQLIENQENGPGKNVSKCEKALPWPELTDRVLALGSLFLASQVTTAIILTSVQSFTVCKAFIISTSTS